MRESFFVDVVLAMYTWIESNDGNMNMKCAFLRDSEKQLFLPSHGLTTNRQASQIVVDMAKQLTKCDLRLLDIIPLDFIDWKPDKGERVVTLAYKILIPPTTRVYTNIEFINYDELKKADNRIAKKRDAVIFRRGITA